MRELREPTLPRGGFRDSRDISTAVGELVDISRMRSQAHEAANLFRDFHIEPGSFNERRLRRELSSAEGLLARWAILAANEEFRTVDLARVENRGDWEATAQAEADIGELALELFMKGEIEGVVERDAEEAKRRIMVDPGLLSGRGLIAIRRKRLMLATLPQPHEFRDMRPTSYHEEGYVPRGNVLATDAHLEVDKVSEFVMDFQRLRVVDNDAAEEIRSEVIQQRGPAELTDSAAAAVIEAAILDRNPMLTPAITTYYADRKYKNIRPAANV